MGPHRAPIGKHAPCFYFKRMPLNSNETRKLIANEQLCGGVHTKQSKAGEKKNAQTASNGAYPFYIFEFLQYVRSAINVRLHAPTRLMLSAAGPAASHRCMEAS
jgi:hypothetical protein